VEHIVIEEVRKAIQAQRVQIEQALASGAATDWAAYKRLVGQVEGMNIAEEAVVNALKTEFRDED
jgi:hypothetical protein